MLPVTQIVFAFILTTTHFLHTLAAPAPEPREVALIARQQNPPNSGPYQPYYSYWWTDNGGQSVYTNGPAGQFSYVVQLTLGISVSHQEILALFGELGATQ